MSNPPFHTIEYPSSRRLTFDMGKVGLLKHHVKALLEVDVTDAWTVIQQSRRSEKKISFFVWLLKVIADTVALHPQVAGFNDARHNQTLVFENVDISTVVEKEVKGSPVPLPYVIRKADQKTLPQIQEEIETVKAQSVENEGDYVLGKEKGLSWMKLFVQLPQVLRLPLFRIFLSDPRRARNAMGSVMVTTVGMVGHTHGWIMPVSIHPLCLALGSINDQPWLHKGAIEKRRILHLTVLIDHDVIDGAPAGRFIDDLVVKLESAYGLPAAQSPSHLA